MSVLLRHVHACQRYYARARQTSEDLAKQLDAGRHDYGSAATHLRDWHRLPSTKKPHPVTNIHMWCESSSCPVACAGAPCHAITDPAKPKELWPTCQS